MARVLMVTAPEEGGLYSMRKDYSAPIRIYSDRWVEDDIVLRRVGRMKRERLTKNEYRIIRKYAKGNDDMRAS